MSRSFDKKSLSILQFRYILVYSILKEVNWAFIFFKLNSTTFSVSKWFSVSAFSSVRKMQLTKYLSTVRYITATVVQVWSMTVGSASPNIRVGGMKNIISLNLATKNLGVKRRLVNGVLWFDYDFLESVRWIFLFLRFFYMGAT